MHLEPGRVQQMINLAVSEQSCVICHGTLYKPNVDHAVCRGFFDSKHRTAPLQVADRLGMIEHVEPPLARRLAESESQ